MTLIDTFGRIHRDLRISLTDKCSLRCQYCLPSDFHQWIPNEQILTANEIEIVVEAAVSQGVSEVRLTGGEPLLRPDLVEIVRRINELHFAPQVTITTNGVGLSKVAHQLANAGLHRINISLDTLKRERFHRLTFRDRFDDVLEGIAAAKKAGLAPIKINSVLLRGVNDDEAVDLLNWALENDLQLRFIEQMPLEAGNLWASDLFIKADEILNSLHSTFSLTPVEDRGSAPAQNYYVDSTESVVGIIASVTKPFCESCDRLRLTADGQLRNCLFAHSEMDLRSVLRDNSLSKAEKGERIALSLRSNIHSKLAGHGINKPGFQKPQRPMSAIGG